MRIELNEHIVADSDICHGTPTFKGTRIMVWQILDLLGAGNTPEDIIREDFPQLSKEAILSALSHASKVIEEEKYVLFPR
jgi:uncharacterized protein (DUF433 family)